MGRKPTLRSYVSFTMNALKKLGSWLAPPPQKADDGRDQWPSRMSFILASCGGAIGMGNLLRFPSQVYNNLGVGLTGRVVYFTMGLPVIMTIILIGRSVSLENAGAGIKLYFATWYGSKLADGKIWQDAVGQV